MSLPKNSVHIDQATTAMSMGQVADIKEKSMAQVTVAQQAAREAQTNVAKSSSVEGSVYGAIGTKALLPGASELISTVMEFVDARRTDKNGMVETGVSSRTIDNDIKTAMRAPGLYKAEPEGHSVYDGLAANARSAPLEVIDGGKSTVKGVFEKAMLAEDSLKGQPQGATGTWEIPPKKQGEIQEAKMALEKTYGLEKANEVAYNSALVAEQQQSAMMYKIAQAAPNVPGLGNSMAGGPKIRPADLLNQIEQTTTTTAVA